MIWLQLPSLMAGKDLGSIQLVKLDFKTTEIRYRTETLR